VIGNIAEEIMHASLDGLMLDITTMLAIMTDNNVPLGAQESTIACKHYTDGKHIAKANHLVTVLGHFVIATSSARYSTVGCNSYTLLV
jgi:hypothetical protein